MAGLPLELTIIPSIFGRAIAICNDTLPQTGTKGRKDQPAVKATLHAWFAEASRASWSSSADVTRHHASASVVGADRAVFNIKGNDCRLVVAIDYEKSILWIKWIGTHGEYDKIDVRKVRYGD